MDKTIKIALVIVIVIALAGTALFFAARDNDADDATDSPTSQRDQSSDGPVENDTEDEASEFDAIITYTDGGFTADGITVRAGDTVQVVNKSTQSLDFSSDPHPVHSDQNELNIGFIAAGESRTFVITQTGTWGFHDHNDPTLSGSITVE